MKQGNDGFEEALARAVQGVVPDDAGPFVIGDHLTIVETMFDGGIGLVVIAHEMTPSHLKLLVRGLEHIVENFVSHEVALLDEGDADAT